MEGLNDEKDFNIACNANSCPRVMWTARDWWILPLLPLTDKHWSRRRLAASTSTATSFFEAILVIRCQPATSTPSGTTAAGLVRRQCRRQKGLHHRHRSAWSPAQVEDVKEAVDRSGRKYQWSNGTESDGCDGRKLSRNSFIEFWSLSAKRNISMYKSKNILCLQHNEQIKWGHLVDLWTLVEE